VELHVDTSSREPIYRQLATQVREGVARGRLLPGEKLPSVRELSRSLVVNPNTIARAYTELEREGVLNTRQGMGVFVVKPTCDLTKSAKRKKLEELLDGLLTEAVYLGFQKQDVLDMVAHRAEQFEWGHGK
jgi:GntR family transcriptional regulator